MPAKSPVAPGADQVVDQAEQAEAQTGEQHEWTRDVAAGLVAEPEGAQGVAPGLDDQHGQHDEQAGRGRERAVAEVPTLQRRSLEHIPAAHDQEPHSEEADHGPEHDQHRIRPRRP